LGRSVAHGRAPDWFDVRVGEIWLVRHGETEWSAAGRHTGRTDIPLTAVGEEQARGLMFRLNRDWAAVLSSPLQRALRTAELAGFHPLPDPDLMEIDYGPAEGRTTAELSAEWPWTVWDRPLGETWEEVGVRVQRVLDQLPDGDVLVFGHGHVLRALTAVYLGLPAVQGRLFSLETARTGVLSREHDHPVIRTWNL
jgi:probable phosphoglycerate mutase